MAQPKICLSLNSTFGKALAVNVFQLTPKNIIIYSIGFYYMSRKTWSVLQTRHYKHWFKRPLKAIISQTRVPTMQKTVYPLNWKSLPVKQQQCALEEILPNIYEHDAHMVAFRVVRDRLLKWIRALRLLYYEYMGNNKDLNITWSDDPLVLSSPDDLKTISIEMIEENNSIYKITVLINWYHTNPRLRLSKEGFSYSQTHHR